MRQAWIVDLLSSVVMAAGVGVLVSMAGAPYWAALGFALVYYLLRPTAAQHRALGARRDHRWPR